VTNYIKIEIENGTHISQYYCFYSGFLIKKKLNIKNMKYCFEPKLLNNSVG